MFSRIYKISHKADLGPMWMNKDNLSMCLHTKAHCFEGACQVEDVTEEMELNILFNLKEQAIPKPDGPDLE